MYAALRAGHRAMRMTSLRESESPRVSGDGYDESPGTVLSDSFSKENESRKNRPLRLIRTVLCDSSKLSHVTPQNHSFDNTVVKGTAPVATQWCQRNRPRDNFP